MIGVMLRTAWLSLRRDRIALIMTFVLPIVFFTIFAAIFSNLGGGVGASTLDVIVVDDDGTEVSRRFAEAIGEQDGLDVRRAPPPTEAQPSPAPYTRDSAIRGVRTGAADAAVIVPSGFGATFASFGGDSRAVEVIYDAANPLAQHTVSGLLQAAAMTAAPDVLMENGLEQLGRFGGGLTPAQRAAVETIRPFLRGERDWSELDAESEAAAPDGLSMGSDGASGAPGGEGAAPADGSADGESGFRGLVAVEAIDARTASGEEDPANAGKKRSMATYYAAGIGVMFLLFSMTGAAGTLIEEEQNGTLERLLVAGVGMGRILASYWAFFAILGALQVGLMFVWGSIFFDVPLWHASKLAGATLMTLATAAAGAAFGIVLATLCRSRGQLAGISTVVILIMSAVGGSMVPRFVMPAFMQKTSLYTFNGWALEGYLRVFWYDAPGATVAQTVASIAAPLAIIAGLALLFLGAARAFARRWEIA
jgi:ABC-2 type transport system permease protein